MVRTILRILGHGCAGVILCALLYAQDWRTATTLPGVDLNGLSETQKTSVLKLLRERDCSCTCGMKVAQCRVEDPKCSYSQGLTTTIVAAIKSGKSEQEALAAADASKFAHMAQESNRVLEDAVRIPVTGAPVLGTDTAKITLVEFSDFQCPYCAVAAPELQALVKQYPAQIKLIFKQFPLENHPQAPFAAAAALAAQKQGHFWSMHDQMFANNDRLSRQAILSMAQAAGLDMKRFEADANSTAIRETIIRDVQDGDQAGVQGTPTVFINGQRYNGQISAAALKPLIEAELKRAPTPSPMTPVAAR